MISIVLFYSFFLNNLYCMHCIYNVVVVVEINFNSILQMLVPGPLLEAKADGTEKEEVVSVFQRGSTQRDTPQKTVPHLSTCPNDNW